MRVSATVITRNEEKNIADCLTSLEFADEIIVVDSGSTDRTEELCRLHPRVKFFHHPWQGYGEQKNVAASYASNDWILNLDADERVSDCLRRAVEAASGELFSAARVCRENYFGRQWIRHCGWYPDYTFRLYDRRCCRFSSRKVHEALEHDGRVMTLEGNLLHFTYQDIADYLRRMDSYSTLAAEEMVSSGIRPGILSLTGKPFFTFFKMYIIKRGFLDGAAGFLLSVLYSVYTFCKYAKARERLSQDIVT